MRSDNIAYLPAIDQLRGIAAVWIVLYHAYHLVTYRLQFGRPFAPDHWPAASNPIMALVVEGHAAVGLFMVLSGFILTYGAWGRHIDYLGFLRNRLLRIYPLAVFLLAVAVYSMPERFNWGALWQTLLLGHNLPGAYVGTPYTDMFWAISVEFQFYLIFPLLCVILRQRGWQAFALLVLALLLFRFIAVTLGANARDLSYLTIVGRLDEFVIGMLLGAWRRDHPDRLVSAWWLPAVVVVWAMVLWGFNRIGGWPTLSMWKVVWPTLEGMLSSAFIFAFLCFAPRLPKTISEAMRRVGLLSYSLYLVHMVVIALVLDHLLGASPPLTMPVIVLMLVLPGTLLLATATYFGIEKPFLGLRGRYLS